VARAAGFQRPDALPKGLKLITLPGAGDHITKLPKAEHSATEWQTAIETLIKAAEHGGG
jgi:hypothetical protein